MDLEGDFVSEREALLAGGGSDTGSAEGLPATKSEESALEKVVLADTDGSLGFSDDSGVIPARVGKKKRNRRRNKKRAGDHEGPDEMELALEAAEDHSELLVPVVGDKANNTNSEAEPLELHSPVLPDPVFAAAPKNLDSHEDYVKLDGAYVLNYEKHALEVGEQLKFLESKWNTNSREDAIPAALDFTIFGRGIPCAPNPSMAEIQIDQLLLDYNAAQHEQSRLRLNTLESLAKWKVENPEGVAYLLSVLDGIIEIAIEQASAIGSSEEFEDKKNHLELRPEDGHESQLTSPIESSRPNTASSYGSNSFPNFQEESGEDAAIAGIGSTEPIFDVDDADDSIADVSLCSPIYDNRVPEGDENDSIVGAEDEDHSIADSYEVESVASVYDKDVSVADGREVRSATSVPPYYFDDDDSAADARATVESTVEDKEEGVPVPEAKRSECMSTAQKPEWIRTYDDISVIPLPESHAANKYSITMQELSRPSRLETDIVHIEVDDEVKSLNVHKPNPSGEDDAIVGIGITGPIFEVDDVDDSIAHVSVCSPIVDLYDENLMPDAGENDSIVGAEDEDHSIVGAEDEDHSIVGAEDEDHSIADSYEVESVASVYDEDVSVADGREVRAATSVPRYYFDDDDSVVEARATVEANVAEEEEGVSVPEANCSESLTTAQKEERIRTYGDVSEIVLPESHASNQCSMTMQEVRRPSRLETEIVQIEGDDEVNSLFVHKPNPSGEDAAIVEIGYTRPIFEVDDGDDSSANVTVFSPIVDLSDDNPMPDAGENDSIDGAEDEDLSIADSYEVESVASVYEEDVSAADGREVRTATSVPRYYFDDDDSVADACAAVESTGEEEEEGVSVPEANCCETVSAAQKPERSRLYGDDSETVLSDSHAPNSMTIQELSRPSRLKTEIVHIEVDDEVKSLYVHKPNPYMVTPQTSGRLSPTDSMEYFTTRPTSAAGIPKMGEDGSQGRPKSGNFTEPDDYDDESYYDSIENGVTVTDAKRKSLPRRVMKRMHDWFTPLNCFRGSDDVDFEFEDTPGGTRGNRCSVTSAEAAPVPGPKLDPKDASGPKADIRRFVGNQK